MGKVTQYHPVNLTYIRASFIEAGILLGKVYQKAVSKDIGVANYEANFTKCDDTWLLPDDQSVRDYLEVHLPWNIRVTHIWRTKFMTWKLEFSTQSVAEAQLRLSESQADGIDFPF